MRDPETIFDLLREMAKAVDGRLDFVMSAGMGDEGLRIMHHLELLRDAGHVEWEERRLPRITNEGYDFIEAVDKNEPTKDRFLKLFNEGRPYLSAVKAALELFS